MDLLSRSTIHQASPVRTIQVATVQIMAALRISVRVAMEVQLQPNTDNKTLTRNTIMDSKINPVPACQADRLILHQEVMVRIQTLSRDLPRVHTVPRLLTYPRIVSSPRLIPHITKIPTTMHTRDQTSNTSTLPHRPKILHISANRVDMTPTTPRHPYPLLLDNININSHQPTAAFLANKAATVMQTKADQTMDNRRRLRRVVMGSKVAMVVREFHLLRDGAPEIFDFPWLLTSGWNRAKLMVMRIGLDMRFGEIVRLWFANVPYHWFVIVYVPARLEYLHSAFCILHKI